MNRVFVLLSAALLAGLSPATRAQEEFTFETDFQTDQVYTYRLVSASEVEGQPEASSTTEVAYHYEVLWADEDSFTINAQIDSIRFTGAAGEYSWPDADGKLPGAVVMLIDAIVKPINALEITYDDRWNLETVSGFAQIVRDLLRGLPSEASDLRYGLAQAVERVLGPLATAVLKNASEEDLTHRLFAAGTVRAGMAWDTTHSTLLLGTGRNAEEVVGFELAHAQPVCKIASEQSFEYSGLFGLLGYRAQRTEGHVLLFANGLPAAAELVSTVEMRGQTVTTVTRVELVTAGEDEGTENPYHEAIEALEAGEIDKGIEILTAAMDANPHDSQGWFYLARAHEMKAFAVAPGGTSSTPESGKCLVAAAAAFRHHIATLPEGHPVDSHDAQRYLYNEACGHAVNGDPEQAMTSLKEAIEYGWDDADHMTQDPDLESLRSREDFKALLESLQEGAGEEAKSEVAKLFAEHKPFDFTFELPDLAGTTRKLADYQGKVLIVDFWGTWCPPCRREIPHFVALHEKYNAQGLEIVGINYEGVSEDEAKKKIEEFAKENRIPYPCLLGDKATQDRVPEFRGYPTTLFVDRTGKVRLVLVGYHDEATLESVVETLLDEKTE